MVTDFYNISPRVYWDNQQHNSYWTRLPMLLHYLEKIITSFEHFGRYIR